MEMGAPAGLPDSPTSGPSLPGINIPRISLLPSLLRSGLRSCSSPPPLSTSLAHTHAHSLSLPPAPADCGEEEGWGEREAQRELEREGEGWTQERASEKTQRGGERQAKELD
eukprot:2868928-Rhodomonas_salina.1